MQEQTILLIRIEEMEKELEKYHKGLSKEHSKFLTFLR